MRASSRQLASTVHTFLDTRTLKSLHLWLAVTELIAYGLLQH